MFKVCYILFLAVILVSTEDTNTKKDKDEDVIHYVRPSVDNLEYLAEPFHNSEEFSENWILSSAKKDGVAEDIAKYDGKWLVEEPKNNPINGDFALIFASEAKHGAVSRMLQTPFKFEEKPLIIQYEVRFQNKHECGGAYVKLLADTPALKLQEFGDKTEYSIMFGPDKCGGDSKLHFIFQHENPLTHEMEEKHAKKPSKEFSNIFDDQKTHLVRLTVKPDNTFEIRVDRNVINEGSLLHDMEPPVNPAKEIDDPEDKKPTDWDEREKIPDPDASKPDDWDEDAPKKIEDPNATKPSGWLDDEPELIPDPEAKKPDDWDDEEDGEWEAPQINNPKCTEVGCGEWKPPVIDNPNYKGKWTPPLISNPKYKGIWKPRKIENPNYFEDLNPFAMKSVAAIGFELWSMQADIVFDNILIADNEDIAEQWTRQTWELKNSKEVAREPGPVEGFLNTVKEATDERPWLWAIIVVLVLVPILLIYFFCCGTSKTDKDALHKKTDEYTPDDDEEDEEEDDQENSESDQTKKEEDKVEENDDKIKEEKEKSHQEENVVEGGDTNDNKKSEKHEKENEEKDGEEETPVEASQSPRTRSRRKTRKE